MIQVTDKDDFQVEKQLMRAFYAALDAAKGDKITEVLEQYTTGAYLWRGFHPFNEQTSARGVRTVLATISPRNSEYSAADGYFHCRAERN